MDMVSPVLDVASRLWNCTAGHASYITGLDDTLTSLRTEEERLIAIRDDVMLKVQLAEEQGMKQSNQVEGWLTRVEDTKNKVNEILLEHEDISSNGSTCLTICRCRSFYKLGKKSTKMLIVIQELISKGEFSEVAIQQPRPAPTREAEGLYEIPMGKQNPLGIEYNLEKVWKGLKDENVGIIGLYGMGGVGKTTLLKKINNELPRNGDDAFEWAFWVVASKNATVETIQQNIMSTLKISYETLSNNSVDTVCNEIYKILKNKKYILMLDDVWKTLDLFEKVGIPNPDNQNKSKIIFTTRSKGVCSQMEAQIIIRVECLPWEEAWSLFQKKVGKATQNAQIQSYAVKVAKECKGLPLALITVGRAMSGKESPYEWSHALDQLQNFPEKIPDLEEEVFHILQLSYDYLADSNTQKCFLYCSLFPEDWEFHTEELVNLWMGEGYLNEKLVFKNACDYGYSIIEDLKRACLLETVVNGSDPFCGVKMHDVMRDMALWIAKKDFLVVDNLEIMRAKSNDQYWNRDVKKMSVWKRETFSQKIEEGNSSKEDQEMLIPSRECPNLSTLLFSDVPREVNLWGLMNFIPNVRLLSFLGNCIMRELPEGISNLENLEYLDISGMFIRRLPKEMKRLRKLRYLLINNIFTLEECPAEIISNFTELLVFHLGKAASTEQLLRGLEKLQKIQSIKICLDSPETVNYLQKSEKLQLCTTSLRLRYMTGEEFELSPTNMRNLESLSINGPSIKARKCKNPSKLMNFNDLRFVSVHGSHGLTELDILAYAPSLINLEVSYCNSIERIIKEEEARPVFLSLKNIRLMDLASLVKISNRPLSFPTLEKAEIRKCPKLKQSPFNDMDPTTSKLRHIEGDRKYLDSLKWRDDSLQLHFSQFFKNRHT